MAEIVTFPRKGRPAISKPAEAAGSEVIVFPRTNIRALRRLWGLPEYGALIAGPDGRAVGASGGDALAG